jgi:cyanate permease
MQQMLRIYGYASVICAAVFIILARERPASPPGPGDELVNKFSFRDALRLTGKKDFKYLMICIFVVMGIFNAVMTWIEDILRPRGITPAMAGLVGSVLVIVGLIGAVILPTISDRIRKRRPLLLWPIIAFIPAFAGFTFFSGSAPLLACSAIMGFCIMGMGPVAFQYGAEIAYPVAEGTSFGLLMGMGQISGIIFIYGMDALRSKATGSMTASLAAFIVLTALSVILVSKLGESNIITGE